MWINFTEKAINLETYFQYLMKGVYFRHLNVTIGLQLQLSLNRSRMKKIRKPGFLEKLRSDLRDLTFPRRLEEYRQTFLRNGAIEKEKISSEILEHLITEFNNLYYFLDIPFNKENMLKFIVNEISLWLKSTDYSVKDFLSKCGEEFSKSIEDLNFLKKGSIPLIKNSPQDLQSFWDYFFGSIEDVISRMEIQIETLDGQNNSIEDYISKYQLQSKLSDTMRLKLMIEHPYEQVIQDLMMRFEDWLALCFSTLVKDDPKRFLNVEGLKFRSEMKKLIKKTEGIEILPNAIVTALVHLERLNVGNAGKSLKNYIVNHAKFEINDIQQLFPFYVELRKLRDGIVHPIAVQKSKLEIPKNNKELLDIINKLTEFGLLLIRTCNFTTLPFDKSK